MRIAHRFNWHYAPPIYPEGDTMLWCKWCGFREVVRRGNYNPVINNNENPNSMFNAKRKSDAQSRQAERRKIVKVKEKNT